MKFENMKFIKTLYKKNVPQDLIESMGIYKARKKLKNGITVSIIADSEFASPKDNTYEIAFFKDNVPIEIPGKVKKKFRYHIEFKYFLTFIPEDKINWIIEEVRKLPKVSSI